MKIVVLDGYTLNPGDLSWDGVRELADAFQAHDRTPVECVVDRSLGADILLTNKAPISRATIDALPDLEYIGVLATGFNQVDTGAAAERGIPVTNVPEYGTESVAQYTVALMLELASQVGHHSRSVIEGGEWEAQEDFCYWKTPLVELAGKTIGIVGFGRIGKRVAEISRALGMKVIAAGSGRSKLTAGFPFKECTTEDLFAEADIVSLHCPLTENNEGLVDARLLARMKPSAFLVNTARGQLINEEDLAHALNHGVLAGAAVDVVSKEPVESDNPLLRAKNIVITPHIAWAARPARERLMKTVVNNIKAWKNGRAENVVNGVKN